MPNSTLERLFREESGRILATLIRVLGDFDQAEEAMQDAFSVACERWHFEGVPRNPAAWILTTARRKAIDRLRRDTRNDDSVDVEEQAASDRRLVELEERLDVVVEDDSLRLLFTCCHPALALDARIALTLRTLGGLTTAEIASAFLVPTATLAQRLVRAKKKIHGAAIPYRIPPEKLFPERLPAVLRVVYLIFSEGYAASSGAELVRRELCDDALRLARHLVDLIPDEPEVGGLLALCLLQDARRRARVDVSGDIVLLEAQDRSLWNRDAIDEALGLLASLPAWVSAGSYQLQAAIAAEHGRAARAEDTDWPKILALYDFLCAVHPSPVVELNRVVALAMVRGPGPGLARLDELAGHADLADYLYLHSTRGELLRRLERFEQARCAFERARDLSTNASERSFLTGRIEASRGT